MTYEKITALVTSERYLQAAMIFHNGNGMLGGPTVPRNAIKRMNGLNLEINFDLYAQGKSFQ